MRRFLLGLAFTLACLAITVALFDRAYPLVDAGLRLTREEAIARARTLAAAERLAPARARAATRFETNDTLSTYVDLAAGGPDSVRALGEHGPLPVFTWAVRLFEPGSPREVVARFTPDGRLVGVDRALAQDERRPYVSDAEGELAADSALARWGGSARTDWRFVSSSYRVVPRSERVERTYLYERLGRRIGEAPVRAEVTIVGDSAGTPARGPTVGVQGVPLGVRLYPQIPEAFHRRYQEMRSANELYANLTVPGMGIFLVAAIVALGRLRGYGIRWRPAGVVGAVVGGLLCVAALDAIPGAWFDYDTATSPTTFVASLALGAVASGVGAGFFVATVLAAAEALTRRALPMHYDWWAYWRHRGAPPIARRILGGYALAAFGFAYVTLFYIGTRTLLGWWVPTGTLDDPNQIASPLPWVAALGVASFAGTWEEAIFRAVPLALLALYAARRPHPRRWLAVGVVVTALVFGFGHANYESWPAYSRGAELFVEAALWAVLYLRIGLPTTIVAHALYDLTWFGLFSLHGRGGAYRVTFAIVLAALLFPAVAVVQGWLARRRMLAAGGLVAEPPRLGDWRAPEPPIAEAPVIEPRVPRVHASRRWRVAAIVVAIAAAAVRLAWPRATPLGPPFGDRARAIATADSMVRARGGDPARWRRFVTVERDDHAAERGFLEHADGAAAAARVVTALATTYLPSSWWAVRYVHTAGALDVRAEQWLVRVLPDGTPLDARHAQPESRPGAAPTADAARALALRALATSGLRHGGLREVELEQTPRPARTDTRVEYEDTTVHLPTGASARTRVTLTGSELAGVTRRVRLPEAFQRAERERASRRALGLGLAGVAALVLIVSLVGVALRAPEVEAPLFASRRGVAWLGVAAALASVATWTNGLPGALGSWPTDNPWPTFLMTTLLSAAIGAGIAGVLTAALWGLTDALRRRAGIPFWPPRAMVRDAVLAGIALGTGITAVQFVLTRLANAGWPVARGTVLGDLAPWLHDAVAVLPTALGAPAAASIGLAVAVGAHGLRRWVALGSAAIIAAAGASAGAVHPAQAAAGAVAVLGAVVLCATWFGGQSGLAWVYAALAAAALGAVWTMLAGETIADVVSGGLGVVTAVVLGVVLWRAARRLGGGPFDGGTVPAGLMPRDD